MNGLRVCRFPLSATTLSIASKYGDLMALVEA